MEKKIYQLDNVPRLFGSALRLDEIGWMPDHAVIHRKWRLDRLFVCLILNRRGEARTEINGVEQDSPQAPYLSVLTPGTVLQTVRPARHDELFFCYREPAAAELLRMGVASCAFSLTPEIETLVGALRRELMRLDQIGAADRLDQLAVQLFCECRIAAETMRSDNHAAILAIASAIAARLPDKVNLDKLLRMYGMARRTFYREWKRRFQCSPAQFMLAQRLDAAGAQLRRSANSIGEIAMQCGFGSIAYFEQQFRRKFGCAPRAYRDGAPREEPVPNMMK